MPQDDNGQDDMFMPIRAALPKINPPSRVKQRLIESAVAIADDDPESLLFQHAVFCQVGLPYRDPGNHVHEWDRKQGFVHLQVEAGKALHFDTGEWVKLDLPWGPKPRLILRTSTPKRLGMDRRKSTLATA